MTHSSFIIAAPSSESGKSTVTIGLLRMLYRRGTKVQPFKCGPDYIDPKLHLNAAKRASVNLDLFMQSEESIKTLYNSYLQDTEISIVEGVMGLFDGFDKDRGSTAHLAELLNLPIVLVLTPKSMAYSVAPLLYGITRFRPQLNIIGVIFNKVNSPKHRHLLQIACNDVGVEVLGFIPTDKSLALPSRHLGLITDNPETLEAHANKSADLVEQYVNIDKILEKSKIEITTYQATTVQRGNYRIAVARDEAFNFIYPENIKRLEEFGTITYFSLIHQTLLPECDLLYLPGGYPELFAPELSHNHSMIGAIQAYAHAKRPILAECGGMLYLSKSLILSDGTEYPLVGLLQHSSTMQQAKLTIGYRQLELLGEPLRGHEFHYSHLIDPKGGEANQRDASGQPVDTLLFQQDKLIATYTHLTFTHPFIHKLLEWGKSPNTHPTS